jgi:hypothetical protein
MGELRYRYAYILCKHLRDRGVDERMEHLAASGKNLGRAFISASSFIKRGDLSSRAIISFSSAVLPDDDCVW